VVLKQQNEQLDAASDASPLLFELESLRALEHPGLAAVREVWQFEELLFLVCDLPDGKPLIEAVEPLEGPASAGSDEEPGRLAQLVRLAAALADALSHAHGQGLTHRDLRTEDILVKEDGSPMILGLCWASLLGRPEPAGNGSGEEREESFTLEARFLVDTGEDVKALGMILWWLLVGRPLQDSDIIELILTKESSSLPDDLARIVGRCLEMPDPNRIYSAAELSRDLERFASSLSAEASPARRNRRLPGTWKNRLPGKRRLASTGAILSLVMACVLTALALTWIFPEELRVLPLSKETSRLASEIREIRAIENTREKEQALSRLKVRQSLPAGSARIRTELGRLYMQQNRWAEALREFLAVRHLDKACFIAKDLLDLTCVLYDGGHTGTAEWLADQVIDWHPGSEWAWKALLLKKHLLLDEESLERVAASLETMLEGPLRQRDVFRDRALPLLAEARTIALTEHPVPPGSWVLGDFLPGPGNEIASFDSDRLIFSNRGIADPSRDIPLKKNPLSISRVVHPGSDPDHSDLDWIAVNHASGRLDIYDPETGDRKESFDVGGRLSNGVAAFRAGKERFQYGFFVSLENGMTLAVMDRKNGHARNEPQLFRFEGTGFASIHPLDFYTGIPGTELVLRIRNAGGSQVVVLGWDDEAGRWREIVNELLPERTGTTLAMYDAARGRSRIFLGVDSPCLPGNASHTGLRKPGLYELVPVEGIASGNGAISAPSFSLSALKVIDPGFGWSGMSFLDSSAADFTGEDGADAAFLVRFAGQGRFKPETRVLVLEESGQMHWLHAPEARSLECGDLDGEAGPEILVERQDHILGVAWKNE
jgi:hypothetical protein